MNNELRISNDPSGAVTRLRYRNWQRHTAMGRASWEQSIAHPDTRGRFEEAQPLGPVRHVRQCVGMVRRRVSAAGVRRLVIPSVHCKTPFLVDALDN